MATLKDFVVNRGLVVNTAAIVNGVDVLANDYATLLSAYANDVATLTSAHANDASTYTTLVGFINNVSSNVSGFTSAYQANDAATIGLAYANDITTLNTAYANDVSTLTTAYANDASTFTTITGNYQANDVATLNSAYANDASTLLTARSNDAATLASALANDYTTYTTLVNEYQANDATTYTTLLGGYRANDAATYTALASYIDIKANSSVTLTAGDGLTGGGNLAANVSFALNNTVVRTSGDQTIGGEKTFADSVIIMGDLTVEGNTTTIGTTSLLVDDKFIQLAANTTGSPVGDVGIYLNRGSQGNSAIYYDESAGYFALAHTADPATNTEVFPTSYATLKIDTLLVSNSTVVTNLNADQLDGQSGSYYVDFTNATNTNLITLDRVLANGNSSTHSITVGGLTVDSNTFYVDSTNNFVSVGTLTPKTQFQVNDAGFSTSVLPTTTTTANQVLDTFAAASFRTAKYLVQVHDTANNYYHSCEILLIHDGSTVYMTEYAIIYTSISLATFNADIAGGNVRLLVTPTNNTNTIRVVRSALLV